MIIDFHTHVFPDEIRENRARYFQGEPAFERLYRASKSKMVGSDQTVQSMEANGIDTSVVFGFPWKNPATVIIQNDYVMESMARYPGRLIGFCCIDPFMREPIREIERCLAGGMRGVGELAFYERDLDEAVVRALSRIMVFCEEKNLPVLIHTNEPVGHHYPGKSPMTLNRIFKLVAGFPKNKIVLAHWGAGLFFYSLMKKEVKEALNNVYFDTAASPFLYEKQIYKIALELAGEDKIVFGSDYPLIRPERYFRELAESGLRRKQKKKICGKNAAKLLGLETA